VKASPKTPSSRRLSLNISRAVSFRLEDFKALMKPTGVPSKDRDSTVPNTAQNGAGGSQSPDSQIHRALTQCSNRAKRHLGGC